jgi:3-isopropylmalate dehydrogenase
MGKTYRIAVVPGDGTGPEVIAEGLKVLHAASGAFGFKLDLTHHDLGGERYKRTGEIMSDDTLEKLKNHDAIYLGAIGHPDVKPGILEKGILLKLRFSLDQYINLRPVKLYPGVDTPLKNKGPEDIDFVYGCRRCLEARHRRRGRNSGIHKHAQGGGEVRAIRV